MLRLALPFFSPSFFHTVFTQSPIPQLSLVREGQALLLSEPEPASESRFHPGRSESTSSSRSALEAPRPPVLSERLSLSSSSSGEEKVEWKE